MTGLRTLAVIVAFAILALAGFEGASPSITEASARDSAKAVATAAAHQIFLDRTSAPDAISKDARAAADAKANAEHVALTAFAIDVPTDTVHVTISKQARSIVLKHTPWRHYDDVIVTTTARPS